MQKNAYLILILSICFLWHTNAQEKSNPKNSIHHALTFHLLDVESGLSNNYINSIEEDDIGRIWIATSDGLNRYDGTTFEHFKTNNSKGLTNNNISLIELDSKSKNLILATDDGINIYDPRLEVFKKLKSKTKTLSTVVNCFTKNKDGKLIISMLRSNDGLYIENESQTFVPYWEVFSKHQLISSSEISCLAFQNDSILWIGTFHSGLIKLNLKSNQLTNFTSENSNFSNTINTLFVDKLQNIWVGTKEGLNVILKNNQTKQIKISDAFEKGLSDKIVLSIEEDDQDNIWIGTRNGGLNILNKNDFLTQNKLDIKWYLPKTDGTSVFNRTVSCIKKDRNGNMWLGTSTGVNFVNPKDEPAKLIKRSTFFTKGLSHNRIGSLALANNGEIWIGTDGGGLDLLNPTTNTIKNFKHNPTNPNSLSNNFIISVFEDSKNRVWVGTYQGGVNLLNPQTGISKKYLSEEDVRVIFEDQSNKIWVGTNRAGLFCYNNQQDHFEYIPTLGKIDIRDIKQGADQSIWLATFGDGIIQFYPKTSKVLEYNSKTVINLPTDVFFSLEVLKDGDLLLGSRYEGLMLLNPSSKVISKFTEKEGLSNNSVVSILKENDEFYWLGTNNGINRYNVKSNKTFNLSTLNNIQTSAFNIHAAVRSKEGHLYFGGNKGLNIFYPERLKNTHEDCKLIFKELKVLNEPVDISSENAVLNKSISYADEIRLQHHQSLFSVAYTVLKYPQNKNITYSYILEGYHDQWIKSYGLGEANFSKTPPGKYILKVKATLDSGEEVSNQITVIISPPFWKTLPAYFLYILICVALFYFGMKYYSERIKLKNSLIFEKKQRQLEHDLNEERMLFFTNFSHELKTPLTLILAPLDDLIKEEKSGKNHQNLLLIRKNAEILYQYIHKLLVFRKSETGHSQLEIQQCNINQIIEQIEAAFAPLTRKKGIQFTVLLPSDSIHACLDLEKFQIILNNLISNAIKHTQKGDYIEVHLASENDQFKLIVKDSGTGIDEKDLPFIFNWFYQAGTPTRKKGTGVGLALVKNFVELHNGDIFVENNSNSSGVTFTITLPINKHLFSSFEINEKQDFDPEMDDYFKPTVDLLQNQEVSKKIALNNNRKLVLLVDDNKDILTYLESLLSDEYDLIFANNGLEGIVKAIQYVPNIIISDIMMPEKSGVDLCHQLKNDKTTSHIPIILLTAKGNNDSIKIGYDEGADDYITKPFNSEILKTRINNLIVNREKLQIYFTTDEPLNEQLSSNNIKLIDKEKKFLMDLKASILKNIKDSENFNVDSIAKEIGLSRSSLYRKINAMTGGNINDFIRKTKLEKAAYLIKNEGLTISQASYEVGFNSINYFRKIFKKEFGTLPSDYKDHEIDPE